MNTPLCPCGTGKPYAQCCKPYHQGKAAATALLLMRSRYSAYVMRLHSYLHQTWHPDTRPPKAELMRQGQTLWLGLEILSSQAGQEQDSSGLVEFKAYFAEEERTLVLHETSHFVKLKVRWVYVDGQMHSAAAQEVQND